MNSYQEIYIPYKDIAFFLIFSLSLVMPIVPFEFQLIFSIFSLSIIFLMSNKTFNKQGFNFIKPLLIILLVAIASGFGNFISGDFYFYLRDGYYLLQPLIYIFIGYAMRLIKTDRIPFGPFLCLGAYLFLIFGPDLPFKILFFNSY